MADAPKDAPKIDGRHEAHTGWAGDLRVGKRAPVAIGQSSTVRDFRGLHTEKPDHYAWVDASFVEQAKAPLPHERREFAPISFHHLSAETAATLDKMHLVVDTDARGRVWQYDFDVSFGEHRFSPAGCARSSGCSDFTWTHASRTRRRSAPTRRTRGGGRSTTTCDPSAASDPPSRWKSA